ncbi:hypothetical protein Pan216_01670 [Planctomycetes bacterium Pan216]|uniref:Uncharacterized protein n=2 Tax=Kolteria novifilia TaxID=2527975 RepID=A0A518AX82_9BACT|nr:hypothetical protein Pan216_01670 [Planctomycetes bacterium Pan216]
MELVDRLQDFVGAEVVIDCASPYAIVGTLVAATSHYVELRDADMHDLRDSATSRENYVVKAARHGVAANRKQLIFRIEELVGVSRLKDVIVG